MRFTRSRSPHALVAAAFCCFAGTAIAHAQMISALAPTERQAPEENKKKDGWTEQRDEQTGTNVMSWEMSVHPCAEPLPALKYQFLPDAYQRLDGNAAIYYLKAMGFLEQGPARQRLEERYTEAADQARRENKDFDQVPPEVWRLTPPAELPLEAVKEYLQLTSFQPPALREAARRDRFQLDRNLRDVEDPIAYLLPEVQVMRSLARLQDLRCRVAIAEGRLEDAIEILGQQFAMARHLAQDDFLVSNLVGIACVGIAFPQALHLAAHPAAPNLYWAYASLPQPLVTMDRSLAMEHRLLYEQFKVLKEVDEHPRPAGYWSNFVDRIVDQLGYFGQELGLGAEVEDSRLKRAAVVAYIAAAYPGARRYLIETWNISPEQLDGYCTTQVVMLAVVRFHDQWSDHMKKWANHPYWQARGGLEDVSRRMREAAAQLGFSAAPAVMLLPAINAVQATRSRGDQQLAILQCVEAIRMFGAHHGRQLPASLDDLPVPAPPDPVTGQAFNYQVIGPRAIITGARHPGIQYRVIVQFAQPDAPSK